MIKIIKNLWLFAIFFVSCTQQQDKTVHIDEILPTKEDSLRQVSTEGYGKGRPVKPPKPGSVTAGYLIYLDFDGQIVNSSHWNGGQSFVCAPAALTQEQKDIVVGRVVTDYAPYKISITTSESVFSAAPIGKKIRVIVTPTSSWRQGVSGIAYTGSIDWTDGTPAFVFSDRLYNIPEYIGVISVHETGHTLGLTHQAEWSDSCTLVTPYRMGVIMGNGLYNSSSTWIYGTTAYGCNVYQNDPEHLKLKLGLK